MNTGVQRSSTTPLHAATTTTPVGKDSRGKPTMPKNLPVIMAMHQAAYVATATLSHLEDFAKKLVKAKEKKNEGFVYLHVFCPCPVGWRIASDSSIQVCRMAVRTNYFPLWEAESGKFRLTHETANPRPVQELTGMIGKFAHLKGDQVEDLQRIVDERNALIKNYRFFLLWARLMGHGKDIKAGEYHLHAGMPPVRILAALSLGAIVSHPVTIPEGYTIEQIGALLGRKELVDSNEFVSLAKDPKTAEKYGIPGNGLEGYLYPDTYQFGRGLSARSVIETMIKRFRQMVGPLESRAIEVNLKMEDVVVLASIVEKETGRGEERPIIASVFLNRLKKPTGHWRLAANN